MSLLKFATILLGTAGPAAAHGYVTRIDVDGTIYGGYLVDSYRYEPDPPKLIAWSTTATDTGYVSITAYDESDIICHRGSAPGALSAKVAPGGSVTMHWSTWPSEHHGPVITYLANCNGDCSTVEKTCLEFFKIDAGGRVDNTGVPGTWATDQLISANYSRTIKIPSDIQSGNYVLRHEIVALHGAENINGAQNYPQCINLKVTGSGTASPSGTLGTALYKNTDSGIHVDIWNTLNTYIIPGPTLYTAGGAATASSTHSSTSSSTSTTSTLATTTAAHNIATNGKVEIVTTTAIAARDTNANYSPGTIEVIPSSLYPQTSTTTLGAVSTTLPKSSSSVKSEPVSSSPVAGRPPTASHDLPHPGKDSSPGGFGFRGSSFPPLSTPSGTPSEDNKYGHSGDYGDNRNGNGQPGRPRKAPFHKVPGSSGSSGSEAVSKRRHARDISL